MFNTHENKEMVWKLIKERENMDIEAVPNFVLYFNNACSIINSENLSLIEKNKKLIDKCHSYLQDLIFQNLPKMNTAPSLEVNARYNQQMALTKQSKKEVKKSVCIRPTEIKGEKIIFQRNLGYVEDIYIHKLFLPNKKTHSYNQLSQEINWELAEEPFIVYSITINTNIENENNLFIRKSTIGNIVSYECDDKLPINTAIKNIEIRLANKMGEPLYINTDGYIINWMHSSIITIKDTINKKFKDRKYYYFANNSGILLKPNELIQIEDYTVRILGSCLIHERCICDVDHKNREKHNYNIVEMELDFELKHRSFKYISRMPILHFSLILS